jgi:hypothetical protein
MVQKGGRVNILNNRATLYSVFFLSVVYLIFLLLNYDFPAVFFFGLVGLVSSFFTRNMIIVLSISLIVTMVLKIGGVLGEPSLPPVAPTSETTSTTELVVFDENGIPSALEHAVLIHEIEKKKEGEYVNKADVEILEIVEREEPTTQELLMIPGYQTSIMLSNNSPDFSNPIEIIPVDMESSYGYEFNNPFSKLGQKCGVSDQYSCYH